MDRRTELLRRLRGNRLARIFPWYLVALGAAAVVYEQFFESYVSPGVDPGWYALLHGLLLAGLAGTLVYLLLRGILQRDASELEALRASEERFRSLTSLSADWFWELDAGHCISWLSGGPTVLAFFGHALAFGKRLWEVPGVEVPEAALAGLAELLEARSPFFDFEIARCGEDGVRRIQMISGQPRFDFAGNFVGYRGVGRDVSEKLGAERALGEAKERLELALEGGSLAVWDCDLESGLTYLSEGWSRLLGGEPAARTVRAADLIELVHPEDRDDLRAAFADALQGEPPAHGVEHRMRTVSGAWKWVLSSGRIVQRAPDGRAARMSGTAVDIDVRRRAEQSRRDAEARYRSLIELAPDGVCVHSGGVIEYANPAAARLLKAKAPQKLIGLRLEELFDPRDLERAREHLRFHETGPGVSQFEERGLRGLDGSTMVAEVASVSYLERGRLVAQTVMRDITEQRRAREALAERERRFSDVVEASGEYVWETDAAWRFTYLSARVEAVLGFMRAEILGRSLREFMPLGEARACAEWFARRAQHPEPFRELTHRAITKSGRVIWQSLSGVPVYGADGRLAGYRGTGADVTGRKQAEERIEYLATRDALTGLPNRNLLADRANHAILAAARGRGRLALLLFDLDRFKLVNDSLGHQAGDALLRAVAERLSNTLRREDTLARTGGDEFVLLWDGLKATQDAALAAQRTLGILARPFVVEGRTLNVSASIGISVYPDDGRDFNELLKNADAALHHAKDTGRGRFRFSSPELNAKALERLTMENDLRRALARGELAMHFQPVVSGRGASLVGAEALVRWHHPEKGLLGPDAFIPIAEESGLIRAVGEWTLQRALSQAGAWQRQLPGRPWVAVNVSAHELAEGDAFVARLGETLRAEGVAGERLELEVTERVLMGDLAANVATLQRIGALGVRVAIDDFGTGYSSLAYLRRLPIDKLKIDRSFLRELETSRDDAIVVQTIAVMARSLGLHVAAEGVESEGQLTRLLALGCDEWQGHLFSGPLEAAEFEQLLERRAAAAG
jgi:diguanylate cyclase (GGDEF)-like protein/PAS domain S-box-containing protein